MNDVAAWLRQGSQTFRLCRPFKFGWLIFVSIFMVFLAVICYIVFACSSRGTAGEKRPLLADRRAPHDDVEASGNPATASPGSKAPGDGGEVS